MEIGKRSRNRPVGVLKCAWDLFESSMVRPADGETTVMKEEVYAHRSLETEHSTLCRATGGNTSVGQEAERGEGKARPKAFIGGFKGWIG